MNQNREVHLFDNYKCCTLCKKRVPNSYELDLCPACTEVQLLMDVKEYIRGNVVNEYNVAEHFGIPLRIIKNWIREGRIEYSNLSTASISGTHCQICGATISFGTLCSKCNKSKSGAHGFANMQPASASDKMRFLE